MLSLLPCKEQGVRAWTARGAIGEGLGIQLGHGIWVPPQGRQQNLIAIRPAAAASHELRISAGGLDEPQSG
jgi:hypothetical protein